MPAFVRLGIVAVVAVHVALCVWGGWRHSPTVDEPAYLASGISHWEFGRFELCRVSPPLVRLVAAVPVRWAGPRLDWGRYETSPGVRAEHAVGHDFLVSNGQDAFWLFTLGRWACIPFSLLGAWVSYRWADELFGRASAFAVLVLWSFSPNVLAHAQLLTPDVGVTALSLATCYAYWRWAQRPTWPRAGISGGAFGLAVLAKTNAVILGPALVVGWCLHAAAEKRLRRGGSLVQFVASLLLSAYVVNLGYGFEGSMRPLGRYEFVSRTLSSRESPNRFRGTALAALPVPFPAAFIEGIDLQRRDFENEDRRMKTYVRGKWYDHGWWWYYLYAIVVKVPVGTWVLAIFGVFPAILRRSPQRLQCACYVAIPGAALFGLASLQTGFGHGLRYILPALPFAFLIGGAALSCASAFWARALSVAALAATVVSSLSICPHSMSYFNEPAGGARAGHFHLLDGNVDWGQDLFYVREWIDDHPDAWPVHVAYWGLLPLEEMGVKLPPLELDADMSPRPGWYLISVNHLRKEFRLGRPELAQFLERAPAGRVTYAIVIYHVPERAAGR
ncbi:MAG: glycosyltransferase family 39 protein [Planctomycetaceae bacterium]|nr:glycosyltransferase family 39 protein [Planctomycetaceae bacterium]